MELNVLVEVNRTQPWGDDAKRQWREQIDIEATVVSRSGMGKWRARGEALDHLKLTTSAESAELDKVDELCGELSPLERVTLERDEMRKQFGIPLAATDFCFSYPRPDMEGLLKACHQESLHMTCRWINFVLNGGFVYFDANGKLLRANALTFAPASVWFKLSGPHAANEAALVAMRRQGRLATVTLDALKLQGWSAFGWVHPNENPDGASVFSAVQPPAAAAPTAASSLSGLTASVHHGTSVVLRRMRASITPLVGGAAADSHRPLDEPSWPAGGFLYETLDGPMFWFITESNADEATAYCKSKMGSGAADSKLLDARVIADFNRLRAALDRPTELQRLLPTDGSSSSSSSMNMRTGAFDEATKYSYVDTNALLIALMWTCERGMTAAARMLVRESRRRMAEDAVSVGGEASHRTTIHHPQARLAHAVFIAKDAGNMMIAEEIVMHLDWLQVIDAPDGNLNASGEPVPQTENQKSELLYVVAEVAYKDGDGATIGRWINHSSAQGDVVHTMALCIKAVRRCMSLAAYFKRSNPGRADALATLSTQLQLGAAALLDSQTTEAVSALLHSKTGRGVLSVALRTEAKVFLCQPVVQDFMAATWRGKFLSELYEGLTQCRSGAERACIYLGLVLSLAVQLPLIPLLAFFPPLGKAAAAAFQGDGKAETGVRFLGYFLNAPIVMVGLALLSDLSLAVTLTFAPSELLVHPALARPGGAFQLSLNLPSLLLGWLAGCAVAETNKVRHRHSWNFRSYWADRFNRLDVLAIALSLAALVLAQFEALREADGGGHEQVLPAMRATAVLFLWLRLLRVLLVSPSKGPLVLMNFRMVSDVVSYLVLLFATLLAFGAAFLVLYAPTASTTPPRGRGATRARGRRRCSTPTRRAPTTSVPTRRRWRISSRRRSAASPFTRARGCRGRAARGGRSPRSSTRSPRSSSSTCSSR